VTGSVLSHSFAEAIRAERQESLFQLLLAFALAVAQTLAVYLGLSLALGTPALDSLVGQVPDTNLPWLGAVLLSRGLLQPLNVCVFAFGATVLGIRLVRMRRELQAFYHPFLDGIPLNQEKQLVLDESVRQIPFDNVKQITEQYNAAPPLLVRRLEAGSRRLADGADAAEVHALMQGLSEIDRNGLDSRYTLLRYLTWLIPTIGFLGTVIGMGLAITGFGDVIAGFGEGGADFQRRLQPMLASVSQSLGVAFDTTLLALFLSAVLVALTSIAQMREEALLSSIDEFTLRHFVSRIAVPPSGIRQLGEMLAAILVPLLQRTSQSSATPAEIDEGIALRDIAGTIAAQTEHLKAIREAIDRATVRTNR
jgi:biopolymer transport protein ExbB/TolQ